LILPVDEKIAFLRTVSDQAIHIYGITWKNII